MFVGEDVPDDVAVREGVVVDVALPVLTDVPVPVRDPVADAVTAAVRVDDGVPVTDTAEVGVAVAV